MAAIACAMVLGTLAPARATVMVEVPLADLARDADVIVRGVVERVGVRLQVEAGRSEPHTRITLRVSEWIKGTGDALVRIDEIGGATPLGGLAIAGTPQYRRGDEVVVFLRRTPEGGLRTYAMAQGLFVVQRGAPGTEDVVVRDTRELGLASWAGGEMTVDHGSLRSMRVEDFLGYLRDLMEQLPREPGTTDALVAPSPGQTGGAR
jgi:hypothetical protein